jgi:hypothetical protein
VIQPTRNGGAKGPDRGFHELPESRIQLGVKCSADDFGEAILSGFSRCR